MNIMDLPALFLLLSLAFRFPLSFSTLDAISEGTSFNVEKPEDVLISQNGVFSAGFYSVGGNTFCFAIWFSNSHTIVWMANCDQPVNGKRSQPVATPGIFLRVFFKKHNFSQWRL